MRLLLILLFLSTFCKAQTSLKGTVLDEEDRTPLSFCSIAIKGSTAGTLTNEDGAFTITVNRGSDILVFYYLGYKTKEIPALELGDNSTITLLSVDNSLDEVTIKYDDDYLYDMLVACKKNLLNARTVTSKAYYQLETKINNTPVEMLETYYNAKVKGASIEQLLFKNGRVGVSKYDGRYFASMNTSRAIQSLSLTEQSSYLPVLPLHLNKAGMKAAYALKYLTGDETSHHIEFTPKKERRKYFKGDIWIDKETSNILKINLVCDSTVIHPFVADGRDDLGVVSIYVTHTYRQDDGPATLHHIDFSYKFNYIDKFVGSDKKVYSKPPKHARTKGVVYFYDFKQPFILPYFKYDVNDEDYKKISMFPYNDFFWNHTAGLIHTEEQQKSLAFLEKEGQLLNFKNYSAKGSKVGYEDFIEVNNFLWSDTTRIFLSNNKTNVNLDKPNTYQVKAQIYMDVNTSGNEVHHYSTCIFDAGRTYFSKNINDRINCFVNMYFDLYEIERLRMEDKLSSRPHSAEEIKAVYDKAMASLGKMTRRFTDEVELGENIEAMQAWNDYIRENLGINNMKAFNLAYN